jgi:hypothetical protein
VTEDLRAQLTRPLDRRMFMRATLAASAGGAALAAGCGSGGGDKTPAATQAPAAEATPASEANPSGVTPRLLTSQFVAGGDNRFAVGLVNAQNKLVKDANLHMRFFTLGIDGKTGSLRGEGDGRYIELNVAGAHAHDSSAAEDADAGTVSFYISNAPFDIAGKWVVELTVKPDDGSPQSQVQAAFDVRSTSVVPSVGIMPPASQNDTFATNADTASLCSRVPACPLHDKVIADVLGKGRPLVVMFSTPAFCETRFCGPVLEVLLQQAPKYQDAIDFVHIEVWQDHQLQKYRPAMAEWNLPSEPWIFFMASQGTVAGSFESIFAQEELISALDQLRAL